MSFFKSSENSKTFHRRTDSDAASSALDWHTDKATVSDCHHNSLKNARFSSNKPGVYILRLNGVLLKVGSAEIGVRMRMQQYYDMNPYCGLKEINLKNRDKITVDWQDCPKCKCNELESKLFRKYGKGIWAQRSPHCVSDTWKLLI